MKTLLIMRHAKTEVQGPGQRDFDRRLAERAKSDIPSVLEQLKSKKIKPDLFLSSPATRAISTAQQVAHAYDYELKKIEQNSLIYAASLPTLIKVLEQVDDSVQTVFLFGHNPGLTLLANYLCLPPLLHLPTSGVVCVDFEKSPGAHLKALCGKQRFFIQP